MKYTIELTHKQKAKMDCMMEIVHRYIGFNPKLEPIKTTNVEDTNEYQIGYKTGYDLAVANAQETKLDWGKTEYQRGYNEGLLAQKDPNFVPLQKCPVNLKDCKAYRLGYEDGQKDLSCDKRFNDEHIKKLMKKGKMGGDFMIGGM